MGVLVNPYILAVAAGGPLWSDNFNRADGAWTDPDISISGGTWEIVSNQLGQTGNFGGVRQCTYTGTISDSQSIEADFWDAGDTYGFGLHVNATSVADWLSGGYTLRISPSETFYYFGRAGTYIHGGSFTLVAGEKIRLENVGGVVRHFRDGVQFGPTYTDATPLTGGDPAWFVSPGVETNLFDNIVIDDT